MKERSNRKVQGHNKYQHHPKIDIKLEPLINKLTMMRLFHL